MNNRNNMPNKNQIIDFWVQKILNKYPDKYSLDGYFDCNKSSICFACCTEGHIERCHIKPLNLGGNNDLENIHLLCRECHLESEDFFGDIYFKWFATKNSSNSGSFLRLMNNAKLLSQLSNIELKKIKPKLFNNEN